MIQTAYAFDHEILMKQDADEIIEILFLEIPKVTYLPRWIRCG